MGIASKVEQAYRQARIIPLKENDRYVFFSDCHRGYGGWNDNFASNQNLCIRALGYYYDRGYTYVEVGDGDELWENTKQKRIVENYSHIFGQLRRFDRDGRLIMLWGNHDNKKRKPDFAAKYYDSFRNECSRKTEELFPNLAIDEALRLMHPQGYEIFVLHGHQGDLLNDYLHPLAAFLVRYVWKPLENWGVRDPTRPAYNEKRCIRREKYFCEFAEKKDICVICGHMHRPKFPKPDEGRYFNDGSMVHPRCITAIELDGERLRLVKWSVCSKKDGTLYACRELVEEETRLSDYFTL